MDDEKKESLIAAYLQTASNDVRLKKSEIAQRMLMIARAEEKALAEKEAKLKALFEMGIEENTAIEEAEKVRQEALKKAKEDQQKKLEAIIQQEIEKEKAYKEQVEKEFRQKLESQMERISQAEEKLKRIDEERKKVLNGES